MDEKIQVFERKRFFSGNRIKFLDSINTTINQFKTSSYNTTTDLVITLKKLDTASFNNLKIRIFFRTQTRIKTQMKIGTPYFGKSTGKSPRSSGPEPDWNSIKPFFRKISIV